MEEVFENEGAAPGEAPRGEPAAQEGPPKKKRRRGRRGGRRHRRRPDTKARAATSGDVAKSPEAVERRTHVREVPVEESPGDEPENQETKAAAEEAAADETGAEETAAEETAAAPKTAQGRRRRRGGRSRKPASARTKEAAPETAAEVTEEAPAPAPAPDEPETKKRPRSTRIEARSERTGARARRPRRRLTDEQARAMRGPAKTMLVHEHEERTQIAVLEGSNLIEHFVANVKRRTMVGNCYLGKVQNVLPGMEAAFVDLGKGRNAVLYAGEVNYAPEELEGEAPRIERALRSGQSVLVQVTKDPIGTKGARLTAQISLAGRYLVLAPEQQLTGISRRLGEQERARLRQILREIRPDGHGVIVRTAAEGASHEDLKRDLDNLLAIWEEIRKASKRHKAPALLYEEPELVTRVVRDLFSGDFERVVVDTRATYEKIRSYLEQAAPDLGERIELHEGPLPLFEQFHVTEQIHKALERKVWLPSGGSIVIDRTEAMTVIDVNTGKFVGASSLEDTVLKNNLEAADEVARQLRLRDIGGIIVIDFIDMLLSQNREQVLRGLKRALSRDKTRSQVFEVSSLGLVEMTRKKVSEGLLEAFSEPCPNCEGRGIVITHEID
jgi:ribonuclease E